MKITFEGEMLRDIIDQMEDVLSAFAAWQRSVAAEPVVKPVDIPVQKPGITEPLKIRDKAHYDSLTPKVPLEKPRRERTEKQKINDEKMRVAALERIAAKRAAKAVEKPVEKPVEKAVEAPVEKAVEEPFADPADAVKLRQDTIAELQKAYANGHHKEVMELLSRFGDGAKSFRELPPEAFGPIREAIDLGALT